MGRVDRALAAVVGAASLLVLPLSLLLFLQWPLRDLVHAGSREANDAAQVLFALYVAVALTAATRDHTHLAADTVASRYSPRVRAVIARIAALCIAVPAANDDVLKDLQNSPAGATPASPAEPPKSGADKANDDLMKQLGGK